MYTVLRVSDALRTTVHTLICCSERVKEVSRASLRVEVTGAPLGPNLSNDFKGLEPVLKVDSRAIYGVYRGESPGPIVKNHAILLQFPPYI